MPGPFTLKNLDEVPDSAPDFGLGDVQEARFAAGALEAVDTGFMLQRLRPGVRPPMGHRHEAAEEVYVVLRGSGRAKLDDEIVDLAPLDALRVSPGVTRAFEAGDEGLDLLAFGPRHEGDGELIQNWWKD
jgi:mannose-6-phosphate isomerase-like protein (cupin superfamily)